VAGFPGEFDDASDEERIGPLLPPEDRLWRHPSELGAGGATPLDPVHVRESWLEREPTRANAWTAGLVGALLATGIVVVGTHLAAALGHAQPTADNPALGNPATATTLAETNGGLGATIRSAIGLAGGAVSRINVANKSGQNTELGLMLGSNGYVLTAAAPFMKASKPADSSILVTLPGDTSQYVGALVGLDRLTGLAVIHVNGVSGLPTVSFSTASPAAGEAYFAVTQLGGSLYEATVVTAENVTPDVSGTTIVDASASDLSNVPLGSPIVAPSGAVVGIVIGDVNKRAIFEPSWLAIPVAHELESFGSVQRGWLGIEGASVVVKTDSNPAGVMVKDILARSAADRAGLRPGDLIVSMDGVAIQSMPSLKGHLYILGPGRTISLEIVRRGVPRKEQVTLGDALGY